MTDEELKKYLQWMNREFGQRGYSTGKGPPDMYGRQTITGEEGWSDMTRDQLRTNQFGPNLPSGLGLLNNREDAEQVLRSRLVDAPAPPLKQVPLMTDMLNTSGVPRFQHYEEGFQNRIRPLPHQLEGPETATGPMMGPYHSIEGLRYDPNQKLYDPNYYGTPGQMGQMGAPPPGIIPSSVTGRHTLPNAPYSVTGRSAMSGGEMPGLLNSGGEYVSQALPPGQSTTEQDWRKQTWDKNSGSPDIRERKGTGWMADDRMRNAQNREFRLGQMLLNFGEQSRNDDGWGGPLTHY